MDRMDFSKILQHVFHLFKGKLNTICLGPTDGSVLKMHYRWAFYFVIGSFMAVFYGWFVGKSIHCISHFKGDADARGDYSHICLSYPFVTDEGGNKRYLLFYRWVHWYFAVMAFLFYLPRKISKSIENPKAKKVLEDLTTLSVQYTQAEKDVTDRAFHYMMVNSRTHNGLYFRYLGLNLVALVIDVFILRFTDFMFHDRFIMLVPHAYPFLRDPDEFKDYISQTFPPFASCILDKTQQIIHGRVESLGCHLMNMELYEKIFIIFWFLIYILILATIFHIIYISFMLYPKARKFFIPTAKPFNAPLQTRIVISNVLENLKVGDVYFLYRLKNPMSPARFYELLMRLSDSQKKAKDMKMEKYPGIPDDTSQKIPLKQGKHLNQNDNLDYHNQKNKSNVPNMLQELNGENNQEIAKRYSELVKAKNMQNTSILIE